MGVYDLDLVAGVLWWSRQTYAVFGVDPERFVPTPESVADLIHPDDRPGFLQRRRAAIANRVPLVHEIRIVRGDGPVRWIAHRGRTEYDSAGKAIRTFGVAMDITDRRSPRTRCAMPIARRTTSSPPSRTSCAIRSRRSGTRSTCCAGRTRPMPRSRGVAT